MALFHSFLMCLYASLQPVNRTFLISSSLSNAAATSPALPPSAPHFPCVYVFCFVLVVFLPFFLRLVLATECMFTKNKTSVFLEYVYICVSIFVAYVQDIYICKCLHTHI